MTDDPNRPVLLTTVPEESQAAAIVTALGARGIEVLTTGGHIAGFRAEAPGSIQLLVRKKDLESAQQKLHEIKMEQAEIDWSNVDFGDPEDA